MDSLEELAFKYAPIGMVVTEERIIKSCNIVFCSMFGYDKDALINQSFRLLYTSRQEFEKIRDVGLEPLRSGFAYSDERIMQHQNGSQFWCRFRAHTLTPSQPLERLVLSFALIGEAGTSVSLTKRERQVVLLLSRGLTSKSIARELGISPRTVEDFRARLLRKFKVRNVAELLTHLVGIDL